MKIEFNLHVADDLSLVEIFRARTRMLEAMIDLNRYHMTRAEFPDLRDALANGNVRIDMTSHIEEISDMVLVLKRGTGNAEDLIAWRIAELRSSGEDPEANPRYVWKATYPHTYALVTIRRGSGRVETIKDFAPIPTSTVERSSS